MACDGYSRSILPFTIRRAAPEGRRTEPGAYGENEGRMKRAQSERHARRRVKGSFMKVRLTTVHRSFHSLTIHYASQTGAVRRYVMGEVWKERLTYTAPVP